MSAKLDRRVAVIAEDLVRRKKVVTPLDVVCGLGWLGDRALQSWTTGQAKSLDVVVSVRAELVVDAALRLEKWATERGLPRSEKEHLSATRDRRALRFTASGDDAVERLFRSQWTDAGLSEERRAKVTAPKPPELVVLVAERSWYCSQCRGTGEFHFVEDDLPVCLACADFDHLVYLPSGDAALTRRARKASGLAAVVARWNRSRKRYERRGLLVERAALEEAEASCLADEDARERRRVRDRERRDVEDVEFQAAFARRIADLFPRLAAERARAIAEHAGTRSSGRVGRSAAGRALDERAVTLAVVAAIRHEETGYDAMLMAGVDRAEARERIREDIDRVLAQWRAG